MVRVTNLTPPGSDSPSREYGQKHKLMTATVGHETNTTLPPRGAAGAVARVGAVLDLRGGELAAHGLRLLVRLGLQPRRSVGTPGYPIGYTAGFETTLIVSGPRDLPRAGATACRRPGAVTRGRLLPRPYWLSSTGVFDCKTMW
jgi:hypothetical protein